MRSAKSEESLSSLHNVEGTFTTSMIRTTTNKVAGFLWIKHECFLLYLYLLCLGESKVYRPRRPRSSSDALSASFNGELLDGRLHRNSYDNLDPTEDSDVDDGPICVPALISPPRLAGEDVDLSPPDIGMTTLDFDPMSFQCSLPDATYAFPTDDCLAGAEGSILKKSPSSIRCNTNGSDVVSNTFMGSLTSPLLFTEINRAGEERPRNKKFTTSFSCSEKPTQAVSPIKCTKNTSLTPFSSQELILTETPAINTSGHTVPLSPAKDSSALMGSVLLRAPEPSLSEAFQIELQSKLAAFDSMENRHLKEDSSMEPTKATSSQEQQGRDKYLTCHSCFFI